MSSGSNKDDPDNCHSMPRQKVPHYKDLTALQINLGATKEDVECFQKLIQDETPAEDQMEHNYMLGDQLLYLQGQYERLLRKQVRYQIFV